MSTPRLIVCQRHANWAASIRPLSPPGVPLREVRFLDDCAAELAHAPGSLLLLELTRENVRPLLELISGLGRRDPLARAIVVAERSLAEYEWLLREAGAIGFECSPRNLAGLAHTAANHLRQVPRPRTSFAAEVWDALPWGKRAGWLPAERERHGRGPN